MSYVLVFSSCELVDAFPNILRYSNIFTFITLNFKIVYNFYQRLEYCTYFKVYSGFAVWRRLMVINFILDYSRHLARQFPLIVGLLEM